MWTMWSPLSVATLLLALTAAGSAYQPYQYTGLTHRQAQRINDQSALNYQRQILQWQQAAAQGQGYNSYNSPYLTFRQEQDGGTALPPQPTIQAPPPPPPYVDAAPTGPPQPPSYVDGAPTGPPQPPSYVDGAPTGPPQPPSYVDTAPTGPPHPPSYVDAAPTGPPQPPPVNEVDNSLESTGAPTTVDPVRALCKAPRGQFPGTSCGKYVNCWDDVAVEQECPLGLYFNEQGNYCDYSWNVACADQPTQQQPGGAGGAGGAGGVGGLGGAEADLGAPGAKCPTEFGTYRSTRNCGVFYMCVGYLPFEFTCPAGLNFHKDLQVCDYPYRVECNGVPTNTVPQPTTQPEAEFTTTPSVQISPEGPAPAPVVVDGPPPTYIDGSAPPPPPPTYVDGSAPPPPPPAGVDASQPIVVAEPTPSGAPGPASFYSHRRTPANAVSSGVPCRANTVFRLNQSCSSVAVCRNGLTQVLNCGAGTSYDVYSNQCVSYLRARC